MKMTKQLLLAFLLLTSHLCYSQFSYNELVSFRNKSKDEITTFLNANKPGWKYSNFDKEKDRHTWTKGNDKLMIDYFSTTSKIVKYFTIDQALCKKISSQMGSTLEYELPYSIDYEAEGLQIFKGSKYYVVVHAICKSDDDVCNWQVDLMTASRFTTEKY